jgi:hypothetical protein
MRKLIYISAACLIGAASLVQAAGEIYRWKDASGIWHYSDQPQPGAELISNARRAVPAAVAATPVAATTSMSTATSAGPPVSNEVAQQVRAEAAAAKADQCKKTEEAYTRAVEARRIYKADEKGNRTYLTAAELDEARLQARAARDLACAK